MLLGIDDIKDSLDDLSIKELSDDADEKVRNQVLADVRRTWRHRMD